MSRLFFVLAFAIGLAVVAWIGQGFLGSDRLALSVTGIIAVVYVLGFAELTGFRRTTRQLAERLGQAPDHREQLEGWLSGLPEPVQFAVQKRIDGHFAALPSPQLTPYLVGLLVMLGLLGTFAGMIVTLSGAASALDGSTDLSAIRSALAAPIAGLSLAFGTSIAGVAASAMLGLASTLSRRERLQVSRQLDKTLRQRLHHLSADYQRQQTLQALETQAGALPQMATTMEAMTARMEQLGQQLEQSLTRNQQEFHNTVGTHYQTLADSVAQSLEKALDSSTRLAADRVEPIVTEVMGKLQRDTRELQQHWSANTQQQLAQLQQQMTRNSERENELLDERQRLVQELDSLLESQRGNADSQRQAVDALISGAGDTLTGISERFNTLIQAQSQQLGKLGDDLTGSSQEVGALSDAFAQAVELFSASNTQLQESLTNIQQALDRASSRHDEQLAYYVAQAREVIDLSVSSQKDVIDAAAALRQEHAETRGAN